MATGDLQDIAARIRAVLPAGWFASSAEKNTPVLDAVLTGLAWPWAMMVMLLNYTKTQTRLQTSTGNFIDIASEDYFGSALPRKENESDSAYILRIQNEFKVPRNTRAALTAQIQGVAPSAVLREPWRTDDCACVGRETYGSTARPYGSRSSPGRVFVECPAGTDGATLSAAILDTKAEGIDVFIAVKDAATN